jgi:hypothetical protein
MNGTTAATQIGGFQKTSIAQRTKEEAHRQPKSPF